MEKQADHKKTIGIIFIVPYPQLEQSIKRMIGDYLRENPAKTVNILYLIPYDERDFQRGRDGTNLPSGDRDTNTNYISVSSKNQIDKVIIPYIEHLDFEYDTIVARGNLVDKLRENNLSAPVVDIPFTGYDVIYSLIECRKKYNSARIAIIGRHSVVSYAKGLEQLIDCELRIYDVSEPAEVEAQVLHAMEDRCDAVIGGYTTVACAKNYGINVAVFSTGAQSIRIALQEAIRTVELVQEERERSETYRIITQSAQDGMIYVNAAQVIRVINPAARQMHLEKTHNLQGRPLLESFPYMVPSVEKVLSDGCDISNELHRSGELTLSVNYLPVRVKETIAGVVIHFQNVTKIQDVESQVRKKLSHKGLNAKYYLEDVLYKSRLMEHTLQTARQYAQVSSNILIVGETGTGKELIAQGIHNVSDRKSGPFVAVNCAALTENLLESELFGYTEGAFTGANKGGKMGLFELAHKGTIFLDEISEIPINFQSKLLRILQEREVRRIGDDKVIPIDVRVIAATNQNLQKMVSDGLFRSDLLYRLNILRLYVPPLNKREEDIGVLFENFVQHYTASFKKDPISISPDALDLLQSYQFKGNVRELRNLAERICVLHQSGAIEKEEIQEALFPENIEEIRPKKQTSCLTDSQDLMSRLLEQFQQLQMQTQKELYECACGNMRNAQEQVEREVLVRTMEECNYHQGKAAKRLGIDRSTLWRKLKKYGIAPKV